MWNMFFYIVGVSSVVPKSSMELPNCWKGIGSGEASEIGGDPSIHPSLCLVDIVEGEKLKMFWRQGDQEPKD